MNFHVLRLVLLLSSFGKSYSLVTSRVFEFAATLSLSHTPPAISIRTTKLENLSIENSKKFYLVVAILTNFTLFVLYSSFIFIITN